MIYLSSCLIYLVWLKQGDHEHIITMRTYLCNITVMVHEFQAKLDSLVCIMSYCHCVLHNIILLVVGLPNTCTLCVSFTFTINVSTYVWPERLNPNLARGGYLDITARHVTIATPVTVLNLGQHALLCASEPTRFTVACRRLTSIRCPD